MDTNLIPALFKSSTMTSRQIAELTGKRHDNVLRDIDRMLKSLNLVTAEPEKPESNQPNCEGVTDRPKVTTYRDEKGEARREFHLPFNFTMNMLAGYRSDLRMIIINRWIELETATVQSRMNEQVRAAVENYCMTRSAMRFKGTPEYLDQLACNAVRRTTGVDLRQALGIPLDPIDGLPSRFDSLATGTLVIHRNKEFFTLAHHVERTGFPERVLLKILLADKLISRASQADIRRRCDYGGYTLTERGHAYCAVINRELRWSEDAFEL